MTAWPGRAPKGAVLIVSITLGIMSCDTAVVKPGREAERAPRVLGVDGEKVRSHRQPVGERAGAQVLVERFQVAGRPVGQRLQLVFVLHRR